ncbi:diaminobutyrate acetyltransferase [Actinokineospora sp. HBU206404]|uniref:L-2,4-diaminobutyric acid acetyltransferase n=2 Tax=Actinokineospora xionganensis TaxID=2684470 RepID=A0ABR7L347_9PSEU|nr:diaminobutyrate acetyltransferase [Actinokineospora xionganensis]MBC6447119.1 diaminobutyrate acetyltransferase [Actinokineospora xionganensis]
MSGKRVREEIGAPSIADGAAIWRIARDSRALDLNSSYAYLLWCRDFAQTSAVARIDGQVVGFVIGFLRPQCPDTVVVWQIAVDESQRGSGLGGRLLDHLMARVAAQGVCRLETTITADNAPSVGLFASLARRNGARLGCGELFWPDHFPDEHEAEDLYRIDFPNGMESSERFRHDRVRG